MWLVPKIRVISVRLWVTRFRWELISCSLTALPADEGKTRSQARFCSTHSCWSFLSLLAVRHNASYSQACKLNDVPALSLGGPATSCIKSFTSRWMWVRQGQTFAPLSVMNCTPPPPPAQWLDTVLFCGYASGATPRVLLVVFFDLVCVAVGSTSD